GAVLGRTRHLRRYQRPPAAAHQARALPGRPGCARSVAGPDHNGRQGGRAGADARGHAAGLPGAGRVLAGEYLRGRVMSSAEDPLQTVLAALEPTQTGEDTFTSESLPQINGRVY